MKDLKSQFIDWLETKPEGEEYDSYDIHNCPLTQFGMARGYDHLIGVGWIPDPFAKPIIAGTVNGTATFGALRSRLMAQS